MTLSLARFTSLFLLVHCTVATADYAWIPKVNRLFAKTGFDYTYSSDNFDKDAIKTPVLYQNQSADFRAFHFWVEPEYGIAKDMSASIKIGILNNKVENDTTTLSSTGIGDVRLGTKYILMNDKPLLTLEVFGKIPFYSVTNPTADELVLGDGNFDLGTVIHAGHFVKKQFYFALSPGFLFRFSGYSTAFTLEAAAGATLKRFGFRLFSKWQRSLSEEQYLDSSLSVHDAAGAGGSYARLSGSPSLFSLGYKLSAKVHEKKRVEATIQHSLMGSYAPSYVQFGLAFVWPFDFYKEESVIRIHEVPFDSSEGD